MRYFCSFSAISRYRKSDFWVNNNTKFMNNNKIVSMLFDLSLNL